MSVRVLLIDDHKMMREGLCTLLSNAPDIAVVGEASDGRQALELVRTLVPDVVVIDIEMPGLKAVDATRQIRTENERVKVIALSTHTGERYVHEMLQAGASGYVPKTAAANELLRAVRAASLGKIYLSSDIARSVVERSRNAKPGDEISAASTLGPRECEVLKLIAEGRTSASTSKAMNISVKTVETHRRNIVEKLGLHGTAQLTKYAVREGLTTLES